MGIGFGKSRNARQYHADVRTLDAALYVAGNPPSLWIDRANTTDRPAGAEQDLPKDYDQHRTGGSRQTSPWAHALGLVPDWWLLGKESTNPAAFNAPVDAVATISLFRSSFGHRHCLIPISGYYEWKKTADGRQPYYFTRRDGSVMTIAGLWDEWRNPDTNELIRSCTMMIGEPNKFVAKVCDHMPVILEPHQYGPWLSAKAGPGLLKPAGERVLNKHPVSKRVDRSRASDADDTLVEEVALSARNLSARGRRAEAGT